MYKSDFINIKPMSINNCFQGRRFRTSEFKHWQTTIFLNLPKGKIESKNICLMVCFYLKHPAQSDLDNFLKPLIDCLVKKGIIKDDRYITKIEARKEQNDDEGFDLIII
jgi:Holliday junction resolvase RusA-like endonuclease